MHYSVFVLVPIEDADDSYEARDAVHSYLDENHFAAQDGRWASGPADWYVIGGRWSGHLSWLALDKEKVKAFNAEFEEKQLGWLGSGREESVQKMKSEALFRSIFPSWNGIPVPVWRDHGAPLGYEDDAKIVDDLIWDEVVMGNINSDVSTDGGSVIGAGTFSYEEDGLERADVVGKAWVVVVDCHT